MVREDVKLLSYIIKYCNEKLYEIQESCTHPKDSVHSEFGSNTGNYDPSADTYWTDYYCEDCGKRWTKHHDS